ncbi:MULTISPECIES: PilC/PilY family type IV pilus protein [unclassified Dyella]|uniref:PilC/PilY family type IV pilus protein n=1 Tax=unclassified Dyella TaxID=2634549 RepID=UPI000C82402E|nr:MULTISPECIES: PilC/PilY family type IV pilus protein [unclassified Dyella]MDR3444583.1 PilC/PilY family type IV pilus protein [Dyella sp.]PMQ05641.1 Type IV pilus biogenesis factor PilY1 [Dyella sp. AD56]
MNKSISLALLSLAVMSVSGNASASPAPATTNSTCGQAGGTCSEDFTGASASLQWTTLGTSGSSTAQNACLTAGSGTGSIQQCPSSLSYTSGGTTTSYSIPANETTAGQGALLLTPPLGYQTGAILSGFTPFPLSQGVNITFTTYTFGGDSGGTAKNGADGITFILTDGTQSSPTTTGGNGGAMGYGCSNANAGTYQGIAYGYLGLGIDEFGNFLNSGNWVAANSDGSAPSNAIVPNFTQKVGGTTYYWVYGDNSSGGIYNSNDTFNSEGSKSNGTNKWGGSGSSQYQPERIGLRGSGNTTWSALKSLNSTYYSGTSPNSSKIYAACRSGQYVSAGSSGNYTYTALPAGNYTAIPGGYAVLPTANLIANEAAGVTRNATTSSSGTANPMAWPITYQLKISAAGLLSLSYSYNGGAMNQVMSNTDITKSNGALPTSLRFGFSAGTGGDNNVHEITCFKASPLTSTSSAAANTIQSGQYKTGTQIYLASYSASPWWGSMKAIPLVVTSGSLAAASTATWDGKCTLTSGLCDSMGTNSSGTPTTSVTTTNGFVTPENRVLVTATGNDVTTSGSGVGFSMQQALTSYPSAVQTAFAAGGTTDSTSTITMTGQNLLGWLLGQRCNEQLFSTTQSTSGPGEYYTDCTNTTATGNLNPRTYVLGDIVDSSPTWVGAPVTGQYNDAFTDGLYGSTATTPENKTGAQTYGTFASNNASRLNVVYVGSNDGYLHGFEAGSFTASGAFSDPTGTGVGSNDGKEVVGYMPYNVLLNQAAQLTNPLGSHQYMVDATPGVGDLFYNNLWHTWLVGGVGTNGQEIYALDVTNPSNFTTAKAGSLVMGDWTAATLPHLGNTMGTPGVVRMHNGSWAIIFGNGLNSGMSAGVYIGLVDSSKGTVTFLFLDTGVGSNTVQNGIAYVTPVDLDDDGIMDYLYAGDLQGNVWRFDVTGSTAASWSVSNFPGSTTSTCSNSKNIQSGAVVTTTCSPLFTATTTTTTGSTTTTIPQPIATGIVTATIQTNGVSRNMLYFGTGQQTPQTGSSAATYAPTASGSSAASQQQTFYGIWDWNMSNWNTLSGTQFAVQTGSPVISTSNLQVVTSTNTTVTGQGSIIGYRTLSAGTTICWAGSSTCSPSTSNTLYGWMYNLPSTNEQIIYSPSIINGAVVVNTAIPPATSTTQCLANTQTGWTMAFDATSGGAYGQNFFSSVNNAASGVQANAVGTPTAVTYNGQVYLVSQTVTGGAFVQRVTPPNDNNPARVSWREIRN